MINYKIEYTIKNFSGLKNIKELNNIDRDLKGIYILYDNYKKPLYIGKSKRCIKSRLSSHLTNTPNHYRLESRLFEVYKRTKYKYLSFIEVEQDYIPLVEVGLIRDFKPKFNKEFNKDFKYEDDWYTFLENNDEYKQKEIDIQSIYRTLQNYNY